MKARDLGVAQEEEVAVSENVEAEVTASVGVAPKKIRAKAARSDANPNMAAQRKRARVQRAAEKRAARQQKPGVTKEKRTAPPRGEQRKALDSHLSPGQIKAVFTRNLDRAHRMNRDISPAKIQAWCAML